MMDQQAQEWDAVAAAWERWAPKMEEGEERLNAVMLSLANIQSGDKVVDLATGVGSLAARVAALVGPRGAVVGTDSSVEMIALAQVRALGADSGPLTFRRLALDDSTVLNQTFDAALCRFGLMFADDVVATLGRIHGLLRPGWRFVAALWSSRNGCL